MSKRSCTVNRASARQSGELFRRLKCQALAIDIYVVVLVDFRLFLSFCVDKGVRLIFPEDMKRDHTFIYKMLIEGLFNDVLAIRSLLEQGLAVSALPLIRSFYEHSMVMLVMLNDLPTAQEYYAATSDEDECKVYHKLLTPKLLNGKLADIERFLGSDEITIAATMKKRKTTYEALSSFSHGSFGSRLSAAGVMGKDGKSYSRMGGRFAECDIRVVNQLLSVLVTFCGTAKRLLVKRHAVELLPGIHTQLWLMFEQVAADLSRENWAS